MWRVLIAALALHTAGAVCPGAFPDSPSGFAGPQSLLGEWRDLYSSRGVDAAMFPCMGQTITAVNASAVLTTTTANIVGFRVLGRQAPYEYAASFINVLPRSAAADANVFDLVPASASARWFEGSVMAVVDMDDGAAPGEGRDWYAWYICDPRDDGEDGYEFHVMARPDVADAIGEETTARVLALLAARGLNPDNATLHHERHPGACDGGAATTAAVQ
jgi:hypothetical protein